MITSIAVKASVRCPECSSLVPLNGLHPRTSCTSCQAAFDVEGDLAWWEEGDIDLDDCVGDVLIAAQPEERPFEPSSGEACLIFLRQDPACPTCGHPVPAAEVVAALEQDARGCPCACGGSLPVRPAEPGWGEAMPWLYGLAGEAPAAVVQLQPGQAVAILCPTCGGALTPVQGKNTARCEFCGTSSATPDPKGPARRCEWFHLIIDADEKATTRWSLLTRDIEELKALAADPATPPLELEALATRDGHVTPAVAANPSTPASALLLLASGGNTPTRDEVAKNKNTPREALIALASDRESEVREELAKRADLPAEALELLARDDSWDVRRLVADKAGLSEELLCGLAADPEHTVQEAVTRNPSLAPAVLAMLATSGESAVRRFVAFHKRATPETLAKLAEDEDEDTRLNVAMNYATPADVLASLAASGGEDDRVAHKARVNPSFPKQPGWKKRS